MESYRSVKINESFQNENQYKKTNKKITFNDYTTMYDYINKVIISQKRIAKFYKN